MNISKYMEAIFVAIVFVLGASAAATAAAPKLLLPKTKVTIAQIGDVSTVIVSSKRLSAAQKAMLDE